MPYHAMTPHISGTSLSAQTRYGAGVREILECFFANRPVSVLLHIAPRAHFCSPLTRRQLRSEYLVCQNGQLAGVGAHSYSRGNATGGSEEAAKFKNKKT